jgi:hypothetical protein
MAGPFAQLQLDYIAKERQGMDALQAAFNEYRKAARALGYHALDQREIDDRRAQLAMMEREAETPEYETRQARLAENMGGQP